MVSSDHQGNNHTISALYGYSEPTFKYMLCNDLPKGLAIVAFPCRGKFDIIHPAINRNLRGDTDGNIAFDDWTPW